MAASWGGIVAAATAGGLVGAGFTCAVLASVDREEPGLHDRDINNGSSSGSTSAGGVSSRSRAKTAWNRVFQTIVVGTYDQTQESNAEKQWTEFFQVSGPVHRFLWIREKRERGGGGSERERCRLSDPSCVALPMGLANTGRRTGSYGRGAFETVDVPGT